MTSSPYAWIIDRDDFERAWTDNAGSGPIGSEGAIGPRGANGSSREALQANYEHCHTFKLWDDDKILYATGTLFWNGHRNPEEEFVYGPLRDYGMPMGCVLVAYPGRPEWDCG